MNLLTKDKKMSDKKNPGEWNPALHYQDRDVAHEYDRLRFSSLAGQVFNHQEKSIIRACFSDLPRNTVILDFPCGTGRLAEMLLESGWRVHGADISDEMLDVARTRLARFGKRFTTEVIDALTQIDCEPQFNASLCARVLMHFPLATQIEFLRGVASRTQDVVVINHSLNSPYQRFRRRIKKLLRHQQPTRYPVTNGEIKRLLSESGLKEIKRHRINSLVSEAIYIVARKIR